MTISSGFILYLSICGVTLAYRYDRRECLPPPCARPPDNCRQEFVYEYVNGQKCPVSCKLVCDQECPTPSQESLDFCNNTDPLCFAEKDFITLPDGKRCFNGCVLACQVQG
ncbi:uncharacterized protein LOC134280848 [Saccostrea cucullata]|uniref:uncharacterized protein LOC134280848 n=1 Tax=Saccostrea cuccullata TaxID=36930 RepID=UPI002ED0D317